jgi:hypothetical protein
MGGGKSGGDTTVRYAPYLEHAHGALITLSLAEEKRLMGMGTTPWDGLSYVGVDDAFFSVGYNILDYPSLWDMFGKFVAGLDIETLYNQIYNDMVNGAVTNAVIDAQNVYLQDDIDSVAIPKINAGLRDINAWLSDSAIDAKALIQSQKLKTLSKFSADIKMRAMELALQRWSKHLEWNYRVPDQYKAMNQLYWSSKLDVTNAVGELNSKVLLWNFTIMDHHRQNISALNGAAASSIKGETKFQKFMGGAGGMFSGLSAIFSLFGGSNSNN